MRFPSFLAAAALAVGGGVIPASAQDATVEADSPAADAPAPNSRVARNEARLAERLAGRVAGEPVSCIYAPTANRLDTIEGVGFVYDAGGTIYVARPTDPSVLGPNDIVLIQRFSGGQLCRQDIRQTVDRLSGMLSGIVFIDGFVPYTRPSEG